MNCPHFIFLPLFDPVSSKSANIRSTAATPREPDKKAAPEGGEKGPAMDENLEKFIKDIVALNARVKKLEKSQCFRFWSGFIGFFVAALLSRFLF
jgi:hypothetical protein